MHLPVVISRLADHAELGGIVLIDPTVPRKSAWFLKATLLPWIYWNGMLKGREWLARPLGN